MLQRFQKVKFFVINFLTFHNKYNKTHKKITKNDEKKHFFSKKMLFFCLFRADYLSPKHPDKPNKQHLEITYEYKQRN